MNWLAAAAMSGTRYPLGCGAGVTRGNGAAGRGGGLDGSIRIGGAAAIGTASARGGVVCGIHRGGSGCGRVAAGCGGACVAAG